VFIAALYSRNGYAFTLLSQIDGGAFTVNLSVPLILEYEAVTKRMLGKLEISAQDVDAVLDYVCSVGRRHKIFYLWRPFLKDPKDDMVLELAVAARCRVIVTYNQKDFAGVEKQFGIRVMTPGAFLESIGALE
jgi:predicted nucleic acid-binding protein